MRSRRGDIDLDPGSWASFAESRPRPLGICMCDSLAWVSGKATHIDLWIDCPHGAFGNRLRNLDKGVLGEEFEGGSQLIGQRSAQPIKGREYRIGASADMNVHARG